MATFGFEWKSGPSDNPLAMSFADDVPVYEDESETYKAGTVLNIDTTKSTAASGVVFTQHNADYSDLPVFIAATDALNASADTDLTQPGTAAASLPYINRPGDIWSVSATTAGTNLATTVAMFGQLYGWIQGVTDTTKSVLDTNNTSEAFFLVVGYDDRDAIGTVGGRLLVMYLPWGIGTVTAPSYAS